MRTRRSSLLLAVVLVIASFLTLSPPAASAAPSLHGVTHPTHASLDLETASNPRAGLVSGGQVLVRATLPDRASGSLHVRLNGRDVSKAFTAQPDGTMLGLVKGLRNGRNLLLARVGWRFDLLLVTNHRIEGPVLSGDQQTPFYCETTAYGLPAAEQPDCSAPTQVSYQYRTTGGAFKQLADPSDRPADLATATVGGTSVPYIVRVETGTIDRAVYETAALYDGKDPSPLRKDAGWNGRLVYTFGGGCNAGYHQGAATGGVVNDLFLSQGYAVASSSLNVLDNNCSTIISAEAAMMVKEHVIETYGPVAHTIGWGGSGGAIQQYDIADQYPGILDGIIPGVSFPDPVTTLGPVADCRLLNNYFAGGGAGFSAEQKRAVSGFLDYTTCTSWDATFASRITATDSCNAAIPPAARWDATTNPDGVICNALEQYVNQLGRDRRTGFVRSTLDNVGIQYGLGALEDGAISPAQFADLNAAVGGYDYTGKPVSARVSADKKALRATYRNDIVNSAGQGLATTPIIDQRTDLDFAGLGNDIHTSEWSFVMRERLEKANGTSANQVIIQNQPTAAQQTAASVYELSAMDRWLTAIDKDGSRRSDARKVIANKPADLGDGCYLSATERIVEPLTNPASGRCGAAYPIGSNTRQVAGSPSTQDVLKCRLKPLRWKDYAVDFSAEQKKQLRQAFPHGVCDYGKKGVGQRRALGPWLTY